MATAMEILRKTKEREGMVTATVMENLKIRKSERDTAMVILKTRKKRLATNTQNLKKRN